MEDKLNKKRLYLFLAIVFIISWSLVAIIPLSGNKYGSQISLVILSVLMLIPALSSILTRIITKEGFKNMYLEPRFKKNIKYYLIAYFMTNIFIILGAVVFFMIFPKTLDLNLSTFGESLKSNGITIDVKTIFIAQLLQGILIGPVINIIFTLGEELGWRGYLLQKLSKECSIQKSIIISGVIWGIWHGPVIAMGIFAMIVFCIVVASYLSYLVIKTKSVIPCAIAHSAINAFASIGVCLYKGTQNPFIGPSPTGIIGGSIFIIVGIYCYIKAGKINKPFEEELVVYKKGEIK